MASTTHHDLINAAKSIPRGIGGHYHDIIQNLTEAAVNLEVENHKLRVRIEGLERMIDWKLDAVGKQIQSYEIDTQHHEDSFDPAQPDQR